MAFKKREGDKTAWYYDGIILRRLPSLRLKKLVLYILEVAKLR
jgi:hypothetical protein